MSTDISKTALFSILLIVTIILGLLVVSANLDAYTHVDALLERTKASTSAAQYANRLEELRVNMESRGLTQGHSAILIQTPQNDLALDHQAIIDIRDNARALESLDPTSAEYQLGLKNIHDQLQSIEIDAGHAVVVNTPLSYIALVTLLLSIYLLKPESQY